MTDTETKDSENENNKIEERKIVYQTKARYILETTDDTRKNRRRKGLEKR